MAIKLLADLRVSMFRSMIGIVFSVFFIAIGIYTCFLGLAPQPISLLFIILPLIIIALVLHYFFRASQINRRLRELFANCSVDDDFIVLPREMRVRYGRLKIYTAKHTSYHPAPWAGAKRTAKVFLRHEFMELEKIKSKRLPIPISEDYTIIIGEKYGFYIDAPAYVVDEPDYKSIYGDVVIIPIAPLKLAIKLGGFIGHLSYELDYAMTDLRVENSVLKGSITLFTSTTAPKVRGARACLQFRVPAEGICEVFLANVNRNIRSKAFSYNFQVFREPVVLFGFTHEFSLSSSKITNLLRLPKPVIQGVVGDEHDLQLKVSLDVPFKRDIHSTTKITITKIE